MARKIDCPPDCQEKHNKTTVTMAEIKKDLDYIKVKLDENTNQHHEIIESVNKAIETKADKETVVWLRNVVYGTAVTVMGILGAGLIWLFLYWMQHH